MKFKLILPLLLSQFIAACSLQAVSEIGFEAPSSNLAQDHEKIESTLSSMRFKLVHVDEGVHTYSRFDDIVTVFLNEQESHINIYSLDKNEEASIIRKLQKSLPSITQMNASTCRLVADEFINFDGVGTNNYLVQNRLYFDVRQFLERENYIAGLGLQGKDFVGGRVSPPCNFMNSVHLVSRDNHVSARFRIFSNGALENTQYLQQREAFINYIDSRYFIFHPSVENKL